MEGAIDRGACVSGDGDCAGGYALTVYALIIAYTFAPRVSNAKGLVSMSMPASIKLPRTIASSEYPETKSTFNAGRKVRAVSASFLPFTCGKITSEIKRSIAALDCNNGIAKRASAAVRTL